jgi:hypothetical protein
MKIFDQIYYGAAMSLGDSIVNNAIVHQFAREANQLYYPAQRPFFETLNCLYQDYDNIQVVPFDSPQQEADFVLDNKLMRIAPADIHGTYINRAGTPGGMTISINWDRQIYEYYDLPFSTRYTGFRFPHAVAGSQELYNHLTQGDDNYVLFHQQTGAHAHGMNIDINGFRSANGLLPLKVIEITGDITTNMLQYIKLIENATEIHCAPSSFFCLVDSIFDRARGSLFFHDRRAQTIMQINSKYNKNKWNIVNYDTKL